MKFSEEEINSERCAELETVKKIMRENFPFAKCGLFDSRNIAGDSMVNLFEGQFFTVDMCYSWNYFEVFETTGEEFKELERFYGNMREQ